MNWSRSFAVLAFLAATPAVAQPYPAEPYYSGVVSPREIMRTVAGMGLQPVSEPRLRGNVWIVRGAGREGTIVRVVLDAHSGRVVDMHSVHRRGPYGPGPYAAEPYQPDPRYVMRDQPYTPNHYVPRPGEAYDPRYQGPHGAAAPDDDDDDGPVPQPRGYVPHSSYRPDAAPHASVKKPETKRVASKPASVPVPKARPADVTGTAKKNAISKEDVKKEDVKKDAAKHEEPKREEAKHEEPKPADVKHEPSRPLTSPKSSEAKATESKSEAKSETTGSIPEKKKDVAPTKKTELPPVQPIE
jgi:hypothetical protein